MLSASSRQISMITNIFERYVLLQNCYLEWASKFSRHDDVLRDLEREGIKVDGIKKQSKFNLHSSHWNRITIPIIKKLRPKVVFELKQQFNSLFAVGSLEDFRISWSWLYYIHPVCHELYYFNIHYPSGYKSRLPDLLRSHRMGLKAAKTYIKGGHNRKVGDSSIKACGTVAFKHMLLHPTTALWKLPEGDLTKEQLQSLAISEGDLSRDEMTVAMLLSKRGALKFDQWFSYAPCAINEGPIFIVKAGANLPESFDAIMKILLTDDLSQSKVRQCLQSFFIIKEISEI